ncbi:MAG TPA: hypothetical protein VIC27_12540, partial [Ktedonobacterales bacterium]
TRAGYALPRRGANPYGNAIMRLGWSSGQPLRPARQGKLIYRLALPHLAGSAKTGARVQPLRAVVLRVNDQSQRLAIWMVFLYKRDELGERGLAITTPLKPLIDEKVEYPVVVMAAQRVRQFDEPSDG